MAVPAHNLTFNNMPDAVLITNPSGQKVTSSIAFENGAGNENNANTTDGIGVGTDTYRCYYGGWENFPPQSEWVSFESIWKFSRTALEQSCQNISSFGSGDSAAQIQDIYNSIQQVAESSLVDHRFIFATIMQEVCYT